MVFVEGVDSVEVTREAAARIDGPVGVNLVEGGKSPQPSGEWSRLWIRVLSRRSLTMSRMLRRETKTASCRRIFHRS